MKLIILILILISIFKITYSTITFISYSDKDCSREVIATVYYDENEFFINNGTHISPIGNNYNNNNEYEELYKCVKHKGGSMKVIKEEYKLNNKSSVCALEQTIKSKSVNDGNTIKKKERIIKYTLNNEIILFKDGQLLRLTCSNSHTRQYSCSRDSVCLLENEWENNIKIPYDNYFIYFFKVQ